MADKYKNSTGINYGMVHYLVGVVNLLCKSIESKSLLQKKSHIL
jgi:hypothetical protein